MNLSAILAAPAVTAALTNIFLAVFTVLLTLVLRAGASLVRAKTTESQRQTLANIANIAVTAAEQLAIAGHIDPAAKRDYAEGIVIHELDSLGLSLTPTQIDTAIESAVYDAFNFRKQAPKPVTVTVNGTASPTQS